MPSRNCLAVQIILLMVAVCAAGEAFAQGWDAPEHHLSMQPPEQWKAFDTPLLDFANQNVRHITGEGFIAGYGLQVGGETLIFPYLLIQYKPYDKLPEEHRPTARLDLQGRLTLMVRMLERFRLKDELPKTIDFEAFAEKYSKAHIQFIGFTDDGRFDITGELPSETGTDPIRYHTHGVMGKSGVAMVTLFAGSGFDEMGPVISGPLRSLAFEAGHSYTDLPEPAPVDPDAATPSGEEPDEPTTPDQAEPQTPPTDPPAEANKDGSPAAKPDNTPEQPTEPDAASAERDSTALTILLSALGVALVVVVGIVALVTHRQAQARRERARARRERREAQA